MGRCEGISFTAPYHSSCCAFVWSYTCQCWLYYFPVVNVAKQHCKQQVSLVHVLSVSSQSIAAIAILAWEAFVFKATP